MKKPAAEGGQVPTGRVGASSSWTDPVAGCRVPRHESACRSAASAWVVRCVECQQDVLNIPLALYADQLLLIITEVILTSSSHLLNHAVEGDFSLFQERMMRLRRVGGLIARLTCPADGMEQPPGESGRGGADRVRYGLRSAWT